ncbi:AAA family ATPase [Clostridium perfringens]
MLRLNLENVGMIKKAEIDLEKINIIAGENNIGKSTVNKILYCIIKSIDNREDYRKTNNLLKETMTDVLGDKCENIDLNQLFNHNLYKNINDKLDDEILEVLANQRERFFKIISKNSVNYRFNKLIKSVFENTLLKFGSKKGRIILLKDSKIIFNVILTNDNIEVVDVDSKKIPFNDVILIESTEILSYSHLIRIAESSAADKFIASNSIPDNNKDLMNKLTTINENGTKMKNIEKIIKNLKEDIILDFKNGLDNISNSNEINFNLKNIQYNIVFDKNEEEIGLKFNKENSVCTYFDGNRELPINRVGNGIKLLAMINRLKENNFLGKGILLLLDEPEEGLHPKWQVELSEKLSKIIGETRLVITTHSPYIVQGFRFHVSEEIIKYYNTTSISGSTRIRNVNNNVNIITSSLMEPFKHIRGINGRFTYEV